MALIAHLSDLHLLEPQFRSRSASLRWRLSFLSFGRPVDAERRRERFVRALATTRRAGPDHVVLTGDLTEDGIDAQFELLAELLHDSGIAPHRITLLPGNHDLYDHGLAWDRALAGPLRAYAPTSGPAAQTHLAGVTVLPVSTAYYQSYLFAGGALTAHDAARIDEAAHQCGNDALLVALHHPLTTYRTSPRRWVDGMAGEDQLRTILTDHPQVYALHGHTHEATEQVVVAGRAPQIFSCAAVVADASPVRFYRAHAGCLRLEPSLLKTETLPASPALLPVGS